MDPGGTNIGYSSDPFGHQFWLAHRCYCFIVFLLIVIVRLLLALVLARRMARFGPELARVLSVGSAVRDGPGTLARWLGASSGGSAVQDVPGTWLVGSLAWNANRSETVAELK